MALLNTWASQQNQAILSPLDRLLNNYIQKGDAPLAYLMRGDAQGLLKDLNTPKPVNITQDMTNAALNVNPVSGLLSKAITQGLKYNSLLGKSDVEQSAINRLITQYPELKQQYNTLDLPHAETKGGRILNTDAARELFPEYQANRTLSAQVHEPASTFVKNLYAEKLSQPTPKGYNSTVVFTAGGTGAGKSKAIQQASQTASDTINKAEMIYDTNMNTFKSADDKIQQALKAGRDVRIFYTYRDPIESLTKGALPRASGIEAAFGSGRTVPLSEHLKTHVGSRKTIDELASKYKDNPNVQIAAIDNSRGKGNSRRIELSDLPKLNEKALRRQLSEALEQSKPNISEAIYTGTKDY